MYRLYAKPPFGRAYRAVDCATGRTTYARAEATRLTPSEAHSALARAERDNDGWTFKLVPIPTTEEVDNR